MDKLLCMTQMANPLLWPAGAGPSVPLSTVRKAHFGLLCETITGVGMGWCLFQTSVRLRRKGLAITKIAAEASMYV